MDTTTTLQPAWRDLLRARGRRVTQQRLAVLETLHAAEHLLADEIAQRIRASGGPAADISLQSVYAVLTDLERIALVRKVDLGTGRALYETRVGDNHHHAICRSCGRVEDVPCAVGHAPCLDPGATGILVESADVIFRGLCADCARSQAPSGNAGSVEQGAAVAGNPKNNGVTHD